MKVLITKASSDYWYDIKVFNTMEDIQRFIRECDDDEIIIGNNIYTEDENFVFWNGMKTEDIPIIKQCPLHIRIYDDYIE